MVKIRAFPRPDFKGYWLLPSLFVPSGEWIEVPASEQLFAALERDPHVRVWPRPAPAPPCPKCAQRDAMRGQQQSRA